MITMQTSARPLQLNYPVWI